MVCRQYLRHTENSGGRRRARDSRSLVARKYAFGGRSAEKSGPRDQEDIKRHQTSIKQLLSVPRGPQSAKPTCLLRSAEKITSVRRTPCDWHLVTGLSRRPGFVRIQAATVFICLRT